MIILISSLRLVDTTSDIGLLNTYNPEKCEKIMKGNDDFSYIIQKNPQTGMVKKNLRQGEISGYYYKETSSYYIVHFRDFGSSYEGTDAYNNLAQYISPQIVVNIISELFNANKRKENDFDDVNINTFYVMRVKIDSINKINKLIPFFKDCVITITPAGSKDIKIYTIVVKTKKSIYYLFNFVIILFTIIGVKNDGLFKVIESNADKLVNCVNVVGVPYFIRYSLISKILKHKDFTRLKSQFESLKDCKMSLNYGNTAEHRRDYIKNQLKFNYPIIDVGCGDGFYAISFSETMKSLYYAYDIDKRVLEKLSEKIKKKEITNIKIINEKDGLLSLIKESDAKFDVIITEVIEHMEEKEAIELLNCLLTVLNGKFNKIIITTPNYDFNKNYNLDGKFRHDDHKWEPTKTQFNDFIKSIPSITSLSSDFHVDFVGIGDCVNGDYCTNGVVIHRF